MAKPTILIADDEASIRRSLSGRLNADGYDVLEAGSNAGALEHLDGIDLVLLDSRFAHADGVAALRRLSQAHPDLPLIFLNTGGAERTAPEAMALGAYHSATKPCNPAEISALVDRALEAARLRRDVRQLRANAARPYSLQRIVGNSTAITGLRHMIVKVATSAAPTVLLTGESGTGKDLTAHVIHYASERSSRPFMNITCSALPEQLLESELFGHERGALADAPARKTGLLESADGGTVFLDEVGEMTPGLQAKLLRFLEERTFRRVGAAADIHVDVRVVAATSRPLEEEVEKGRFRGDLYDRLNVLPIGLPPLRARTDDIPLLTEYFIDGFNTELHKDVLGAGTDAYERLQRYAWPGNVRELRNVIERAMLLSNSTHLAADDFAGLAQSSRPSGVFELPAHGVNLEAVERSLVLQALRRCHGNQTRAAALLGLNRDQIRYRVEKFGVDLNDWKSTSDSPGGHRAPAASGAGAGPRNPLAAVTHVA
jgi:DNA-binding NtrC family response regulator